jgi:hypothetical protein
MGRERNCARLLDPLLCRSKNTGDALSVSREVFASDVAMQRLQDLGLSVNALSKAA